MLKNNKLFLTVALPVILLACLSGCVPTETIEEDDENSKMPELISLRQKVTRLENENRTLKGQVIILKEQNQDLSDRSKKLANRCNQLQLETERRTEQVKLLQGLPAERDKFRDELKKQKALTEKLEKELKARN